MFVFCKKKIHFSNAMILEQYKLLPSKMKLTDEKYNFKRNMFLSQIAIDKSRISTTIPNFAYMNLCLKFKVPK